MFPTVGGITSGNGTFIGKTTTDDGFFTKGSGATSGTSTPTDTILKFTSEEASEIDKDIIQSGITASTIEYQVNRELLAEGIDPEQIKKEVQASYMQSMAAVQSDATINGATVDSKASIAIKEAIKILNKYASKIDTALSKAINHLPVKEATKQRLLKYCKVAFIAKALSAYTDFSGKVEDALTYVIQDVTGLGHTAAHYLAVTIMLFLPF